MINRALPGHMIDLIRDGVPASDLQKRGDRAVWSALVRTGASASQRGWDCWEWQALLMEAMSTLGRQACLKRNKRERSRAELLKQLDAAWDKATAWVSEQPKPWDGDRAREEARQRAERLMAVVDDGDAGLLDADRAVLAYAAALAVERGIDRVALPWRAVVAATGLGERSAKNALGRLDKLGLLVLVERGAPGGPSARRAKANLYRLADAETVAAYQYRGTRSVGPAAQFCGTPPAASVGTPAKTCGTPPSIVQTDQTKEGSDLITITLSATDAELLGAALALLRVQSDRGVTPIAQSRVQTLPDNVRLLRIGR